MKSTTSLSFLITGVITSVLLISCAEQFKPPSVNPAFGGYISAFTSGVVSSKTAIVVRLQEPIDQKFLKDPILASALFDITPKIKGSARIEDDRTVIFQPAERLLQDKEYQVKFKLAQAIQVPEELAEFVFNFRTLTQAIDAGELSLAAYSNGRMERQKVTGTLHTADYAETEQIEQTINAKQNGNELSISWSHGSANRIHRFVVDSVVRMELASEVQILVDGSYLGLDEHFELFQEVPALGDFKILSTKVVHQPDQFALITFSDPIKRDQDLTGLVELVGVGSTNTDVAINQLRIYPSRRLNGETSLILSAGIENILGYKLGKDITVDLLFEEVDPAVRTVGTGTILPSTDGTLFPFEAVNLSAIEVRVVRIFENNIVQFLQTNRLDGNGQIKRVGRLIKQKIVRLDQSAQKDLGRWNRYYLDLADLVKAEPGAIYRVELGFKKQHAIYACGGSNNQEEAQDLTDLTENWDSFEENDASFWDFYDDYYYDWYYGDYNYHERNDPCSNSYYGRRRSVSKNFMASDIGLIVKGGNDRSLFVAISDLISTKPVAGAQIEIFNYQSQLIHTLKTDANGMVELDVTTQKPFLLVAEYGGHKGYLKLDDGSSKNLSKFNIRGLQVQKGLKGFIYGDRGVWRPGDSLYLAFILEDGEDLIPDHHPVTLELIDPRGKRVARTVHKAGKHGFYDMRTATTADAPTGNWRANVKIGNALFTKTLRIETVKPNRLKIELDLGDEMLSQENSRIKGTLETKWLHGAIAKDLKARIDLTLNQSHTNFKRYPQFTFDDPVRRFKQNELVFFEGKVDEKGKANIDATIKINDEAPGMLKANFVTRVFEKSGDHSIDRHSITYSPYSTYVGIKLPKGDRARGMLLTDTIQTAHIVTVNESGMPVARDSIHVALYKVQWRWWWQNGVGDLANYFGSHSETLVHEDWVHTSSNGEGKFEFELQYPDWGRYLVRAKDAKGGHATGKTVYIDWPGWAGRAQRNDPEAEQMLVLSSNKETYNVGDKAELFIPTGEEGRALLTIENGSRVIKAEWLEAIKGGIKYQLEIEANMAPNVYAHVSYVQPHQNTRNSLPIRMFGVIPLMVQDPETILHPIIIMPDELAPEKKIKIEVREKLGRAMTYTIAMVDEGLLDLTRFHTPDPWANFFAKEALGVRTWDMFDEVIGAFGGNLSPLLALGGDGEAPNKGKARAERFKPMVRYLGPYNLEANGNAEHIIEIPNYVGSVRTMVVAGNGTAYGKTEKTTAVKKPLMILATLPRVVGPGETIRMPVTVFAMDKKVKDVLVKVRANDLFGNNVAFQKTIHFEATGDKIIEFELKVAPLLGVGKVYIEASSGSESAHHNIEIEVRSANPPIVQTIEKLVAPNTTIEMGYFPIGMVGTNSGTVEISSIPPVDLGRRLQYLLAYPHGCVEQTTSRAFPQLFLSDVMELDKVSSKRAEQNVRRGIQRLVSFQLANGGLAYWPGNDQANDWGTTYAGHFLLEAENKGYTLPKNFKKKWISYQKKTAKNWRRTARNKYSRQEIAQAYRLYSLALANSPELGAMNRMRNEKGISPIAKWRLAAAYQLAGRSEVANALIEELSTNVPEYRELSYTFGSTERDMAMIVETLVLMGKEIKAAPVVKALSIQLSSRRWLNTQATAYALLAISKYAGSALQDGLRYSVSLNGTEMKSHFSQKPIAQFPLNIVSTEGGTLQVKNENNAPIYVRILLEGTPLAGNEKAEEKQLSMTVSYHLHDGTPLDESEIEQGTDLYALVTIKHPGVFDNYREMALTQIFPSGWEVRNARMDGITQEIDRSRPTYQDIRDDRVNTYFDLGRNKKVTFKIRLNAAYLGEFYLPSVSCAAMYDNSVRANTGGRWVRVIPPGGIVKASK